MKTKLLLTVLAVLLLGSSSFSQAGPKDKKECNQKEGLLLPPPPPPPLFIPGLMPPLELLGMTPEQHEKLKAIDMKHLENITRFRAQIAEKQAKLVLILITESAGSEQTNAIAEEIGKLRTGMLKQEINHDQQLRQILSDEQKVIFDALPKPFLVP
jgi:hypothetical protein